MALPTLDSLVLRTEASLNAKQAERQAQVDILDQIRSATSAGAGRAERDLTADEATRADGARIRRQQLTAEIEQIGARLTLLQEEKRQDDAATRNAATLGTDIGQPSQRGQGGASTEHRVGNGTSTRDGGNQGRQFRRLDDTRPAAVERGQSFADHPVVSDYAARRAVSERPVIDTHGSFGNMLRSMTTSSGSAVIPTVWGSDVIDRARNHSAVLQAGAPIIPMESKVLQLGRLTTDPTAAFRAEGSAITASDPSFDNVTLTAKTLSCLVVASLEFLMDGDGIQVDEIISEAIGKAMALELDLNAIFGGVVAGSDIGATGINRTLTSPPAPTGIIASLLAQASSNVLGNAANGTVQTATAPFQELLDTIFTPTDYNEEVTGLIWPSRLARKYSSMVDTTNQPLRLPAALEAIPRIISNQLPALVTQGTATTQMADVVAGDFRQLLIGQRLDFSVQLLDQRYAENGQVALVATWRGDVAVARPRAFAAYRYLKAT